MSQKDRNVLGGALASCSVAPRTGFFRDGCCNTGPEDLGMHVVCARVTRLFLEFAREQGAMAIVKGLRAISDFEYELEMNQLNRQLASDIESIYLMASPQYSFLSSSGVKEIATFGGDVSDLVPEPVARRLKEALAR